MILMFFKVHSGCGVDNGLSYDSSPGKTQEGGSGVVKGSQILENILKIESTGFSDTSKVGYERKRSHMMLRFLVSAPGKTDLPPTEMRKTAWTGCGGKGGEAGV